MNPVAVVHESWPLRLKQIDLSPLPPAQREAEVERLLIDEPRLSVPSREPSLESVLPCSAWDRRSMS